MAWLNSKGPAGTYESRYILPKKIAPMAMLM